MHGGMPALDANANINKYDSLYLSLFKVVVLSALVQTDFVSLPRCIYTLCLPPATSVAFEFRFHKTLCNQYNQGWFIQYKKYSRRLIFRFSLLAVKEFTQELQFTPVLNILSPSLWLLYLSLLFGHLFPALDLSSKSSWCISHDESSLYTPPFIFQAYLKLRLHWTPI